MDRFYLEKLIDDINSSVQANMKEKLGNHLTWFLALDNQAEAGDRHFKKMRYLYAMDTQCPMEHLNALPARIDLLCRRFSGSDYQCRFHFGYDDLVPVQDAGFTFALQFYFLEQGGNHPFNHLWVAALLDEPELQEKTLPSWLLQESNLNRADLKNQILYYAQRFLLGDHEDLIRLRQLEASFWRVVNLACFVLEVETFEDLVDLMPARFKQATMALPGLWENLRNKETVFALEDLSRCEHLSLRFCAQLMELS